jgi:hypothetical protein
LNPESGTDINIGDDEMLRPDAGSPTSRGPEPPMLCTSLLMNGVQMVDDERRPGGNEKVRWITL